MANAPPYIRLAWPMRPDLCALLRIKRPFALPAISSIAGRRRRGASYYGVPSLCRRAYRHCLGIRAVIARASARAREKKCASRGNPAPNML